MRFSTAAVLAVIMAPSASGFVVPSRSTVSYARPSATPLSMAIEDLESKLLNPEEAKKKAKFEKAAKSTKVEKAVKKEAADIKKEIKSVKYDLETGPVAKKVKKTRAEIEAEARAAKEELKRTLEFEKAAKATKVEKAIKKEVKEVKKEVKKAKYDLETGPLEKKIKKEVAKPKPSISVPSLPKPAPKPKAVAKPSAPADASVGPVGVALGAAPLIAVPVIGLAAARGALSKTAARRAQIQKEIAEFEEAKKKKAVQADVDAGTLAKATVRTLNEVVGFRRRSFVRLIFSSLDRHSWVLVSLHLDSLLPLLSLVSMGQVFRPYLVSQQWKRLQRKRLSRKRKDRLDTT